MPPSTAPFTDPNAEPYRQYAEALTAWRAADRATRGRVPEYADFTAKPAPLASDAGTAPLQPPPPVAPSKPASPPPLDRPPVEVGKS